MRSVLLKLFTLTIAFMAANAATAADFAPKLHRHAANHIAWNTNAYFVESESGVVLIDAQLLQSDARTLAAMISATGKPLVGAIITHPHIDHFAGLPVLRDMLGDFPIYAVQGTVEHMERVHKQMRQTYPMPNVWNEALDERLVMPTDIIKDGDSLKLAGLQFLIHDLGPSDSDSNILIYQKDLDVLFAGDSFYPHQHFWIGEAHIDGALKHLRFIMENYGGKTMILPGHANAAPAAQGAEQIEYIENIIAATKAAISHPENITEKGFLTREARAAAVKPLAEKYKHYDSFTYGAVSMLTNYVYATERYLKQEQ